MERSADHQEVAINLSVASKDQRSTPNGDVAQENGDIAHDLSPKANGNKSRKLSAGKSLEIPQHPHNAAMMLQGQGMTPQQIQQLIQQQQGGMQMMQQHMLQQQQSQKFQEQVLQQLNEQLQLNILQQSQLVQQQSVNKKDGPSKQIQTQIQQLAMQQQQLIQQIQFQQRQYILSQGMGLPLSQFGMHPGMSPGELHQLWKEVSSQASVEENALKNGLNGMSPITSTAGGLPSLIPSPAYLTNGLVNDPFLMPGGLMNPIVPLKPEDSASLTGHPLYGHGVCKWPGCETPCEELAAFLKHINNEHQLDDRSTAQARVQMQVVSQLEIQLAKERERLQAMMQHLHMKPAQAMPGAIPGTLPGAAQLVPQPRSPPHVELKPDPINGTPILPKQPIVSVPNPIAMVSSPSRSPPHLPPPPRPASSQCGELSPQPATPNTSRGNNDTGGGSVPGHHRRRVSDKCNLPISTEIHRNREFYKNTDVRPPFTYASLIRQAIIESPNRQLTLNEIYQWFQSSFSYFRRNEATWKNAVRHNLSLHKCFMRVENVKGAVWTVDEIEFYKRRPQKISGNIQLKSPSLQHSPTLYGENLNASLRAALAESNIPLLSNSSNSLDGVEDLSMSRQTSQDMDDNHNTTAEYLSESEDVSWQMRQESEKAEELRRSVYEQQREISQHGESVYHHGDPVEEGPFDYRREESQSEQSPSPKNEEVVERIEREDSQTNTTDDVEMKSVEEPPHSIENDQ